MFSPHKNVGKQIIKINLHNISSDKYLHFFRIGLANKVLKYFRQLKLTSTDNFFPALKITPKIFYLINPFKFTSFNIELGNF